MPEFDSLKHPRGRGGRFRELAVFARQLGARSSLQKKLEAGDVTHEDLDSLVHLANDARNTNPKGSQHHEYTHAVAAKLEKAVTRARRDLGGDKRPAHGGDASAYGVVKGTKEGEYHVTNLEGGKSMPMSQSDAHARASELNQERVRELNANQSSDHYHWTRTATGEHRIIKGKVEEKSYNEREARRKLRGMTDAEIAVEVERVIPQARGATHDQSVPGEYRRDLAKEANRRGARRYRGEGDGTYSHPGERMQKKSKKADVPRFSPGDRVQHREDGSQAVVTGDEVNGRTPVKFNDGSRDPNHVFTVKTEDLESLERPGKKKPGSKMSRRSGHGLLTEAFEPGLHPRGRGGEFVDVLGKLVRSVSAEQHLGVEHGYHLHRADTHPGGGETRTYMHDSNTHLLHAVIGPTGNVAHSIRVEDNPAPAFARTDPSHEFLVNGRPASRETVRGLMGVRHAWALNNLKLSDEDMADFKSKRKALGLNEALEAAIEARKAATQEGGVAFARARAHEEWLRSELQEFGRAVPRNGFFDPDRHPRNRMGKFTDILKKLESSGNKGEIALPGVLRVRWQEGRFDTYREHFHTGSHKTAEEAAKATLRVFDNMKDERPVMFKATRFRFAH